MNQIKSRTIISIIMTYISLCVDLYLITTSPLSSNFSNISFQLHLLEKPFLYCDYFGYYKKNNFSNVFKVLQTRIKVSGQLYRTFEQLLRKGLLFLPSRNIRYTYTSAKKYSMDLAVTELVRKISNCFTTTVRIVYVYMLFYYFFKCSYAQLLFLFRIHCNLLENLKSISLPC